MSRFCAVDVSERDHPRTRSDNKRQACHLIDGQPPVLRRPPHFIDAATTKPHRSTKACMGLRVWRILCVTVSLGLPGLRDTAVSVLNTDKPFSGFYRPLPCPASPTRQPLIDCYRYRLERAFFRQSKDTARQYSDEDDFGAGYCWQCVAYGLAQHRRVSRYQISDTALWLRAERESVHRAQGECHTPPV